jgi:hypothetical protein
MINTTCTSIFIPQDQWEENNVNVRTIDLSLMTSLSTKLLLYHDEQYWSQALDTTSIVIHKINRVIVFNTTFTCNYKVCSLALCVVSSNATHSEVYFIQLYVINLS